MIFFWNRWRSWRRKFTVWKRRVWPVARRWWRRSFSWAAWVSVSSVNDLQRRILCYAGRNRFGYFGVEKGAVEADFRWTQEDFDWQWNCCQESCNQIGESVAKFQVFFITRFLYIQGCWESESDCPIKSRKRFYCGNYRRWISGKGTRDPLEATCFFFYALVLAGCDRGSAAIEKSRTKYSRSVV